MRIALITRRFPPQCCGVGDYTLGLARALGEQGRDVIVITQPEQGVRPAGIQVVEAHLDGWSDLRGTLRVLERERVEEVQLEYSGYGWSRWGFSFWLNALILALRWRGIPVNVGLHETYIRFVDHPRLAPLSMLQRIHIWLLISTASGVYLNMQQRVLTQRRWLPWCRAKIHYRPNSSTIPVAPLAERQRHELRLLHGAGPDDCVVAAFGLFQKGKNLEAVMDAVAKARTARPLRLWLLGDPSGAQSGYIAMLQDRARSLGIQENIFWSGYLAPTEVSAHLQAADLFVLPQSDGHLTRSSAFMAAAAHGLAVIAVRNRKNQHEFENGRNLLLVERSRAPEIAAGIETLADNPVLASELGMNLRRTYRERFDWPVTSRQADGREEIHAALETPGRPEPARKI